ncbi:MAG: hypothetical protein P8X74_24130 [Reinekea sp.]
MMNKKKPMGTEITRLTCFKMLQVMILFLCAAGIVITADADTTGVQNHRQLQQELAKKLASGGDTMELLQQLQASPGMTVPRRTAPAGTAELNAGFAGLRAQLHRILQLKSLETTDLKILANQYQQLLAARLLFEESFVTVGKKLENAALSQLTPRLDEVQTAFRKKFAGLFDMLNPVMLAIEDSTDLDALLLDQSFMTKLDQTARDALRQLEQLQRHAEPRILGNTFLPYRRLNLSSPDLDISTQIQPSYLTPDALPDAACLMLLI